MVSHHRPALLRPPLKGGLQQRPRFIAWTDLSSGNLSTWSRSFSGPGAPPWLRTLSVDRWSCLSCSRRRGGIYGLKSPCSGGRGDVEGQSAQSASSQGIYMSQGGVQKVRKSQQLLCLKPWNRMCVTATMNSRFSSVMIPCNQGFLSWVQILVLFSVLLYYYSQNIKLVLKNSSIGHRIRPKPCFLEYPVCQ